MTTQTSVSYVLNGHLLDSLTLAKVLDQLNAMGAVPQVRYWHVPETKHEASVVCLAIENVSDPEKLAQTLAPYGGEPLEAGEAQTTTVAQDGQIPEDAWRWSPWPQAAHHNGHWKAVAPSGDWVLVMTGDAVVPTPADNLKAGDAVILSLHGLRW